MPDKKFKIDKNIPPVEVSQAVFPYYYLIFSLISQTVYLNQPK